MDVLKSYVSPTRISQPATPKGKAALELQETSTAQLIRYFTSWKLILLFVAIASPGPGYDTSTAILLDQSRANGNWFACTLEYLVLRLTRWDGIYFTTSSDRGHLYEQEWAFSWVLSRVTAVVARVSFVLLPVSPIVKHAFAAIIVSHLSHLLAVVVLYNIIINLLPTGQSTLARQQAAYTTACLHILSPAGIFLSAPSGEATFALFNFLGMLCYVKAIQNRYHTFADAYQLDACWTVAAGICFGVATTIRSNGLLSGMIFAWDVIVMLPRLPDMFRIKDEEEFVRLTSTLVAGASVGVGLAAPQVVAYLEYCTAGNTRPWCSKIPPSIYSFVQSHYWNVGFLRYWTLNNLPLFALALPVGWVMVETALPCLLQSHHVVGVVANLGVVDGEKKEKGALEDREKKVLRHVLPRFALPQLILVVMAATSFHVQILNRISSGYPIWYFILAAKIIGTGGAQVDGGKAFGLQSVNLEWIVRAMVMYAVVQAGLYAAFMPPA